MSENFQNLQVTPGAFISEEELLPNLLKQTDGLLAASLVDDPLLNDTICKELEDFHQFYGSIDSFNGAASLDQQISKIQRLNRKHLQLNSWRYRILCYLMLFPFSMFLYTVVRINFLEKN